MKRRAKRISKSRPGYIQGSRSATATVDVGAASGDTAPARSSTVVNVRSW
jgi:hypothetical protein